MKLIFYPGKIETHGGSCYIGDRKIDCPRPAVSRIARSGFKLDILPNVTPLDKRGDIVFTSVIAAVILTFGLIGIFKIKIFGKTLSEYIKPIWYFILTTVLIVSWQYLFGLKIDDNLMSIRISQWVWESVVAISAYKLSRVPGFGYGNMFFLGIIYSLVIHGLKVSIRYYFYSQTFLYALDRFIYGSLLVMVFAFILGSLFIYLRRKNP